MRESTRNLFRTIPLDELPSQSTVIDFGMETANHLGALQFAVIRDGVTLKKLDEVHGERPGIQGLIGSGKYYGHVRSRIDWDDMPEESEES